MHSHDLQTTVKSTSHPSRQALERQTEVSDAHSILSPERDPLAQVSCRLGDASCAGAHASTLNHATASLPTRGAQSLLQLQRQYGNRYVQRVLALARKADGEAEAAPEVEDAIQRARGGGQALDSQVRIQMESAFGTNFSSVRVHTDAEADTLNRAVSARAFTTGQDIFFRQGEYSPGSSGGRELLAHELTHVVQQAADEMHCKLIVGTPDDQYEQEADQVARAIAQWVPQVGPRGMSAISVPEQMADTVMRTPGQWVQRESVKEKAKKEVIAKLTRFLDADKNGDVTEDEVKAAFKKYDKNGDKNLDKDELIAVMKAAGVEVPLPWGWVADGVIEALDKDGDEKLSEPEVLAPLKGGGTK